MSREQPNIYEYLNYREFVKDMYHFKKNGGNGFSYRTFSRLAGFRSSNFIKLIMDGDRNLSLEGIQKFSKAFKLNKAQKNFFETLVLFNQAKNIDDKNRYYGRIAQTKCYNEVKQLEANQYQYFSNWYYVALRELVALENFREDPNWINKKLGINLSDDEIKKAIQVLFELKLVKRNKNKKLEQSDHKITTSPDIAHLAVLNFHKEMLTKASDSLEQSRTVDRDISALTVSLSKKQFDQIKERINQFRSEIHAIASENDQAHAVYQVNFQLFNLSEVTWK